MYINTIQNMSLWTIIILKPIKQKKLEKLPRNYRFQKSCVTLYDTERNGCHPERPFLKSRFPESATKSEKKSPTQCQIWVGIFFKFCGTLIIYWLYLNLWLTLSEKHLGMHVCTIFYDLIGQDYFRQNTNAAKISKKPD